ncbi:MAG: hypothetical protein HY554_06455 [Elusimicrobia bacterium]|nr:hypothetical protein [Elusimicrobiota bacterium]
MAKRDVPKQDVDAMRLGRILEQAHAHGGLKRPDLSWLARQEAARSASSRSWEQLEFPWAR